MKPQILTPDFGAHNANMEATLKRLKRSGVYKDLSTIIVIPTLGMVPTKCAASWMNLMAPPNQKVVRLWPMNMEVGHAYSQTLENILANPELSKFKYLLTVEADNVPEPDGLLKLLQRAEENPDFSAIGGLYSTKGPDGVPQIWGDPKGPINFRPQMPRPGELVECCGVAMGFTLYRLKMFKDDVLRKPWFVTKADATGMYTQDLYFWEDARRYGYRCAVDCAVNVGHYDYEGRFGIPDFTW